MRPIMSSLVGLALGLALPASSFAQGAGAEVRIPAPPGMQVFDLNLGQTKALSRSKNFEVVGHSYFKGPWLTPAAQAAGVGASFNTPRVYDGIGYFGGYNGPPILFGTLIADVRDPRNMQPLSFIPCEPGTRCPYLRVNTSKKILIGTHDRNAANPVQPPAGQPVRAGVSFYDVSDPRNPSPLGFFVTALNGSTHGFEIDDRFVYACASTAQSKPPVGRNQEVVIIDYNDPTNPVLASTVHITGNHVGEPVGFMDDRNPDGTAQINQCHEINVHNGRLYVAWRDVGAVVIDISNPYNPSIISRLDYVPPFNGGSLGAAHTFMPVVTDPGAHPTLAVLTDEIFTCPPGFGRIMDISTLGNPVFLASFRLPHVDDQYDRAAGTFTCQDGQQSIHQPWQDYRSPGLFFQAWYDQGLRAWDISNPFLPREVGYYVSPRYESFGGVGRHTRESFQDPSTGLIYMTDGNGGGVTVLRFTGPIPQPPIPGAR